MQIYVDLDGVMADLDSHYEALFGTRPNKQSDNVDWKKVNDVGNFYLTMPLMKDALDLWAYVECHDPIILTGIPYSVNAADNHKRDWVAKHLGPHVQVDCCRSAEKFKRAQPGDILIDDWTKYQHLWEQAGGIWITHTSAANTIEQLKERGL